MRNFDLRQFLNDNPLLKEESKAGKHISKLEVGEKFIFNDTEYEFIGLYPELDNAARVKLPNGEKSVVSFGDDGMVNTGHVAGTGVADMGLGKGHHIDEFLGFGKKKEEPEEEEEEEETGPEVEYEDGLTFYNLPQNSNALGDVKYLIAKKYSKDYLSGILHLQTNPKAGEVYLKHDKEGSDAYNYGTDIVEYLADEYGIDQIKVSPKIPKGVNFPVRKYSVLPPESDQEEAEVEVHTLGQTAEDLSKVLENNQELKNALLRAIQEAGINPNSKAQLLDALNNYDVLKQLGQFVEKEIQKEKSDTNELKASDALRQTVELGAIFGTVFGSISGNIPLAAAGGILLLTAIILAPKEDKDDSVKERIDAGGMDTTTLHSVDSVINNATGEMYPLNDDDTIDWENGFSAYDELTQDFIDSLSPEDRAVVAKFSSQLEEEILSEGNCPNCGASGQSGQWTGMYCKRCKYAA